MFLGRWLRGGRFVLIDRPIFHIVRFNRFASAAHWRVSAGVHDEPNPMAKEPSGFHAAM